MNKQSIILSFVTSVACVAGLAGLVSPVFADMCTTQYGGTTTCQPSDLTINKQVRKPFVITPTSTPTKGGVTPTPTPTPTVEWKENLTTTDPTFTPGSLVNYRLIIKNSSGETFNPVTVKDVLPPYLAFHAGPGSYDAGTRTLTFTLENLIAGESRTVEIVAKVVDANQFPAGKSLFCVVNVAQVSALNRFDSDSAQACLQNGPLEVTILPVAGFSDLTMLIPFAGVGLGGLALLKGKKRG